jgi:hypothetical protein
LPLKAFEYAACGLPVVSVPIASLERHRIFRFATTPEEFASCIVREGATREDSHACEARTRAALMQGYDHRFDELSQFLDGIARIEHSHAVGARIRAFNLTLAVHWNRLLSNFGASTD